MLKDDERLDRLVREGIDIIQSRSVFSFSLDAVLLAHFTKLPRRSNAKILDACSGNGAVAFMLTKKTSALIYALEYQERLADMAQRTVALNQLEERVCIINDDYKNALAHLESDSFDVITCNPPYFPTDHVSTKNDRQAYTLARHEVAISLDEWVHMSSRLLKYGGKLFCVHRPDRLIDLVESLKQHNLNPKRIQFVYPKEGKEANIVLIEAIKNGKARGLQILPPITVYGADGQYLPGVKELLYGQ